MIESQAWGQAAFPETRWSIVARAGGDDPNARRALEDLCQAYWFPLYVFARRSGHSAPDAEDYVQDFFSQLLEKKLVERANADKGKLRTFLLTLFKRHIGDLRRRDEAEKRGGRLTKISIDANQAEEWLGDLEANEESAEQLYERHWALSVLNAAVGRLREDFRKRDRLSEFEAMRPFLTESGTAEEYDLAAQKVGSNGNAFKTAISRMRQKFGEALRAEVMETKLDDEDIDEEIRHLVKALG
ncbi:MAG: sigma factor [Verrucomicrobiota bacterium]